MSQEIKIFLATEGMNFPYNDLRVTRNGLHPKWLLAESPCYTGSVFRTQNFFLIPVSALPKPTVQDLIISKSILPVPHDFCEVIDYMETWGRNISHRWEQNVLRLMAAYIGKKTNPGKRKLFYECISFFINEELNATSLEEDAKNFVKDSYFNYYQSIYSSEQWKYFSLACLSRRWIHMALEPVHDNTEVSYSLHIVSPVHSRS